MLQTVWSLIFLAVLHNLLHLFTKRAVNISRMCLLTPVFPSIVFNKLQTNLKHIGYPHCHYGEVYLLPIWVSAHRPRIASRWLMNWKGCGRKWRWHEMRQAYFPQYLRRGSAKHAHFGLRNHIRRCDLSQTRQVGRLPSATFIIRQNVNPFH
jgi:hypothetical protein